MGRFALGQSQLHLRPTTLLNINGQGDQCQALFAYLSPQTDQLVPVEQQLPAALRLVVVVGALIIGGDVHPHQPKLPVLKGGVRVLQIQIPCPHALDLRPRQDDPALKGVEDEIIMPCFAVLRHNVILCFHLSSLPPPDLTDSIILSIKEGRPGAALLFCKQR